MQSRGEAENQIPENDVKGLCVEMPGPSEGPDPVNTMRSPTERSTVYLDHAATSFPKAGEVVEEITRFLAASAGSPGRSGHRISAAAARLVYETREALARLFGVGDSRRLVFTRGATEGLNLILYGLLEPGDHVVTTSMEHNAVMRPLRDLVRSRNVTVTAVPASAEGLVDPDDLGRAVRPNTRLAVINHASNVCGALQPLPDIADRLRGRTRLVIDAAQTAGLVPLNLEDLSAGAIALSGHKGLLGPTGIGVLCLGEDVRPRPLMHGGTGSVSESDEQPEFLPDRYEAGTPNTVGIAGLHGSLAYLEKRRWSRFLDHERALAARLLGAVDSLDGVCVQGPRPIQDRTGVVSFRIRTVEPGEVGRRLDQDFGLLVRCGLHCAPNAHRTLATFPMGTVRASFGHLNTEEDVDRLVEAVAEIAHG